MARTETELAARPPGEGVTVTVVIPAYNPGDLILETLESVFAQTLSGVEVVVVDNGSTDGLAERLAPFMDRIRYTRFDRNRRPAVARNAGIKAARGRYIALLDADDVWMPERLERLVAYMGRHPEIGFATTDAYLLVGDRPTTRSWFSYPLHRFHWTDQDVHIMRSHFTGNKLLFRRELFERHGLFEEDLWNEDWERCIAFIHAGERAGLVREPLAYHRVMPGTLTGQNALLVNDAKVVWERWLRRPIRPAARRVALEGLAWWEWESCKLDGFSSPDVRRRLWRVARQGPAHLRAKAWLLLLVPRRALAAAYAARQRFLVAEQAPWALDDALKAIAERDLDRARRRLAAVALFAYYPLSTRAAAAAWILMPPGRGALERRLRRGP